MSTRTKRRPGPRPLFSRRVVMFEDPAVVSKLQAQAQGTGRSLAAVIRHACRYWLSVSEDESEAR